MCPCKYSLVGGVFLPFDSMNGPQAELMETFKKTNLSAAKDPGREGKDSSTLDSHTDLCTIQKLEDMLGGSLVRVEWHHSIQIKADK